jgi:hypothetical protein
VRLAPLLVLALILAACGSTTERTDVPASSGQESVPVDTSESTLTEAKLKPPPILRVSEVGTQKAVRGSYCVNYVDKASGEGQGICSDAAGPTYPRAVTAVAGGDRVTFVVPDAMWKAGSVVTIRPLGCTDQVTTDITLEPGTGEHPWDVDLDHGAYQLDVFALFEAKDGRTGDVSGTLGLTVAGAKKWDALGVLGVRRSMHVCPFAG